jgi:hypothetical protein
MRLVRAAICMGTVVIGYGQTGTGSIAGTIQSTDGKPVARAAVRISLLNSAVLGGAAPFNAVAATGADGKFAMSGVPAGTYTVCPVARDAGLLPPCLWGTEPVATVVAGQTANVAAIEMKVGVDLYLRVNDPAGTRAALEGKVAGADLMASVVSAKGTTMPVNKTGSDGGGHDHHLTVPADVDLTLVVYSKAFALTDGNGAAIDADKGLSQKVNIPSGTKQKMVVVNLVGDTGKR